MKKNNTNKCISGRRLRHQQHWRRKGHGDHRRAHRNQRGSDRRYDGQRAEHYHRARVRVVCGQGAVPHR